MNDLWDQLDPGFFVPIWLVVGLLGVIAVVLLEIGAHRRREQALPSLCRTASRQCTHRAASRRPGGS